MEYNDYHGIDVGVVVSYLALHNTRYIMYTNILSTSNRYNVLKVNKYNLAICLKCTIIFE